jgi:hypothetical protein
MHFLSFRVDRHSNLCVSNNKGVEMAVVVEAVVVVEVAAAVDVGAAVVRLF